MVCTGELLDDLASLARGEPPQHASRRFAQDDLDHLSEGEAVPGRERTDYQRQESADKGQGDSATVWAILLGAVAAVSILINLIQLATR